ncbi:pentapeptide repeat-containing protein [Pseudanabaena sp. 'Roaring Creek']|uniref:pentapeptide repeat-containing protein n=1 Tax=Pseudanabaena sp. 'Roaring Creek' TaxID=1681830 RepID=UPI0009EA3F24
MYQPAYFLKSANCRELNFVEANLENALLININLTNAKLCNTTAQDVAIKRQHI